MRIAGALIVLSVAGSLVLVWRRHWEANLLEMENARLRQTLVEVQRPHEENTRLPNLAIGDKELSGLRVERSELMKLRSEVGELRQTARVTVPELHMRIQSALADAEAEQKRAGLIQARYDVKQRSKQIKDELSGFLSLVRAAGKLNNGRPPDSFEQLEALVARSPEGNPLREYAPEVLNSANRLGVSLRNFVEFVRQDRAVTIRDKSVLLLRERAPRPSPDGGWWRAYAFADGRVEEAFSQEGNFEEWERRQATGKAAAAVSQKD